MLYELRQFRVKGSGYMSLRLRVPNFPNSAGPSGLGSFGKLGNGYRGTYLTPAQMGQHDLGNWEIGKYIPVSLSQFPK